MGKRDRKSPYLHHETPLSRYGALGRCDEAGRAGSPARPYHHLWLTVPNLSQIGNRKGLAGEKSSLFFQAIRIIREMREATNGLFPAIAVWENVPYVLQYIRHVMNCKQL